MRLKTGLALSLGILAAGCGKKDVVKNDDVVSGLEDMWVSPALPRNVALGNGISAPDYEMWKANPDSNANVVRGPCIDEQTAQFATPKDSASEAVSVITATSAESIEKQVAAHLQASASSTSYGASGSVEMNYSKAMSQDKSSVHIIVYQTFFSPTKEIQKVKLTTYYNNLMQTNPNRFITACGNELVTTTRRHGIAFIDFSMSTSKFSSVEAASAKLEASVKGVWGSGSVNAQMSYLESHKEEFKDIRVLFKSNLNYQSPLPSELSTAEGALQAMDVAKQEWNKVKTAKDSQAYTRFMPASDFVANPYTSGMIDGAFFPDNFKEMERNQRDFSNGMERYSNLFILERYNFTNYISNRNIYGLNSDTVADFQNSIYAIDRAQKAWSERARLCGEYPQKNCTRDKVDNDPALPLTVPHAPELKPLLKVFVPNIRQATCRIPGLADPVFNSRRSPACGTEPDRKVSAPDCPVAEFNTRQDPLCGYEREWTETRSTRGFTRPSCSGNCFRIVQESCSDPERGWPSCNYTLYFHEGVRSCARAEFGVKTYQECHVIPGGFKECRDPSHGVELEPMCDAFCDKNPDGSANLNSCVRRY